MFIMIRSFKTEFQKIKHRHFFLLLLGCLFLFFIWMAWSLRDMSADQTGLGYFHILYELPLLNTIILPLFIAVIASRLWDTEHKGNTFKLLYTLQDKKYIYSAKSLLGGIFLLFLAIGECIMIRLLGQIFHITQAFPTNHIILFFATTLLTSLFLFFLQEIITFLFKNQIAALAVGLIGSFLGLFSLFFSRGLQQFVIWSYYSLLQTVGMNWDESTRIISYYEMPISLKHFFLLLIFVILSGILGKYLFNRKDI